jgi:hypothetical protein
MTVASRFQDLRGVPVNLTFPDLDALGFDQPDVAAAIGRHKQLTADLNDARTEAERLRNARAGVIASDDEALGAARLAGKPDPDPTRKALAAADKAIADQDRQVRGLEIAVAKATDQVVDALEAARPEMIAQVDHALATVTADLSAAVDAWARARDRRGRLHAVRRWAAGFPDVLRYQVGGPGAIAGLIGRNGDAVSSSTVEAALRSDAEGR